MNRILYLLFAAAIFAVLIALTACGGGDPEPEPDVPPPGVDCQTNPKACV